MHQQCAGRISPFCTLKITYCHIELYEFCDVTVADFKRGNAKSDAIIMASCGVAMKNNIEQPHAKRNINCKNKASDETIVCAINTSNE